MPSPEQAHTWNFPVDSRCVATVIIRGGPFTLAHLRTLREHLAVLERNLVFPAQLAPPMPEHIEPAAPGDLVQLRSTADPIFGGLMLRVCQARTIGVRGYLLVPHRGGARGAWLQWKHCEYERVGRVRWPEAEWGFRTAGTGPRAQLWSDADDTQKRPPGMERGDGKSGPARFRTAKGD